MIYKIRLIILFILLSFTLCKGQNLIIKEGNNSIFKLVMVGYENTVSSSSNVDTVWLDTIIIADNYSTVTVFENKLLINYDSEFRVYINKCSYLYYIEVYEFKNNKLVKSGEKYYSTQRIVDDNCFGLLVLLEKDLITLEYKHKHKKSVPISWDNLSRLEKVIDEFVKEHQ